MYSVCLSLALGSFCNQCPVMLTLSTIWCQCPFQKRHCFHMQSGCIEEYICSSQSFIIAVWVWRRLNVPITAFHRQVLITVDAKVLHLDSFVSDYTETIQEFSQGFDNATSSSRKPTHLLQSIFAYNIQIPAMFIILIIKILLPSVPLIFHVLLVSHV